MNKKDKYRLVYKEARSFLDDLIDKNPNLNQEILKKHFQSGAKFDNLQDAFCRLVESMSNRNMMASVINFKARKKEITKLLLNFDPQRILTKYEKPENLLKEFSRVFNLKNTESKRSLWRIYSEGIISGCKFFSVFNNKSDFDKFVNTFSLNKYTKAALPMLLSREIKGFGFALSCDFLKELGYRDYPKPDVHLIKIFYSLGLSETKNEYDVYKSMVEMSETVGDDAYIIDKMFWLISSGYFYLSDIRIGRNRDEFIALVKNKLATN